MKRLLYIIAIILFAVTSSLAQIATYTGTGGNSTAVTGYANETVSPLQATGFGTNTACGSGGRSGITVNTSWAAYSTAGPRVFIQITPAAGYQLNITGFNAGLRRSGTGPACVRFAYSLDNGVTWTDDGACHAPNNGGCGTTAVSSWNGALSLSVANAANGIIVALFPYAASNSTGTFQVNTFNILGTIVPSNNPPVFVGGTPQSLVLCQSAAASAINTLMSITDPDVAQTETWTVASAPANGTLSGFPATATSTGAAITPSGLAYTPAPGFSGSDIFAIKVSDGVAATTTTVNVTVNPLPAPGPITGTTSVCMGLLTLLSDAVPGGVWSSASSAVATISPAGAVTGAGAGADVISYALTNTCGTTVVTATVTVNALPQVYTVTGGGHYCAGGAGVHVGLSNSEPAIGYQLYNGSTPAVSPVLGNSLPLDFGALTAAGTYTVSAVHQFTGCISNMSSGAVITIDPLPGIYSVTGGGPSCAGTPVHVGLANSDAGIDYQLYFGSTPSGSPFPGTGTAIDFGLFTAGGTYTVMAANTTTGCISDMPTSTTIVLTPTVVPGVTISSNAASIVCAGHLITYTPQPVNGGTAPAYEWSVNGASVSLGNTYSYMPANGDVVSVKLTSNAICPLPDTAHAAVTMAVQASQLPFVNALVYPGNIICNGARTTFTAAPVYGGPAPLYYWFRNGGMVATGPSFNYLPADGDDVYCTMKSSFACPVVDSVVSGTVHMTVKPFTLPTVQIIATPGTLISLGQQLTLRAEIIGAVGTSLSYQWLINGIPVVGNNTNQFISTHFRYPQPDSVTCIITVIGGECGDISVFNWVYINVFPVGVHPSPALAADIAIIPNPARDEFTIRGQVAPADNEASIQMINMLGQVVYTGKAILSNGAIDEHIQLSNAISAGRYVIKVYSANSNRSLNITIQR